MKSAFILFALLAVCLAEHAHKLSDKDHFKVSCKLCQKLQKHTFNFQGAEHDNKFDHEAFLGKDTAAEYDALTPEKSKERLA
jgi:hypothetical protein